MKYVRKIASFIIVLVVLIGAFSTVSFAATVGQQLTSPETGWQRIDNTDSKIQYSEGWASYNNANLYKGAHYYAELNGSNKSLHFRFYGTKLRIITCMNNDRSLNIATISIDGVSETYNDYLSGTTQYQVVAYEKTGLALGNHDVAITLENTTANHYSALDAIDIDDTGYLVDITESKLSVLLNAGETVQLSTSFNLDNNKNFTWSSTNEAVATVDANGKVTAIAEGTADIYAQNADGSFKEYIPVKVVKGVADELRLAVHLKTGEKAKLYLTDDASKVTWSSMDESIATVTADGQVNGVKKGLAIIKGELEGKSYQIYVRVNG
nr:Ig-like domain-containing protein [uncultured Aminipila sp.]